MASSSHLWHYTSFDSLKKILENGLKPSVGDGERYDYLGKGNMSFLRVCFTNMGIEDNDIHSGKFGSCFIGFMNEWVNRNHICPVIYCREEGKLTKLLKQIMDEVDPLTAQELCQYCKQYSDYGCESYNGPYLGDKVRLRRYDEHEWRYIPNGYSEEYLKFSEDDVFAIYVTSLDERIILGNMFPKYIGKIKVIGEKEKNPDKSEF